MKPREQIEQLEKDLIRTQREVEIWKEECDYLEGELEDLSEKDRLMRIAISRHIKDVEKLTKQIEELQKRKS